MALTTELPIGLKTREGVKKVFSINDLIVEDLKKINDRQYKADHPMVWLGKTICQVIREIDGTSISGQARAEGSIPDAVKNLTLIDVSYLLLSGHVYNLGSKFADYKANCPACGNHVHFDIDLEDALEVPEVAELQPDTTFTVQLERGFEFNGKNVADIGMEGVIWTEYEFRLPVLGDAIRNERHHNATSSSTFSERIMTDCIVAVRTEDGIEMKDKYRQMIGYSLISKLNVRDMQKIGTEYTAIAPSFSMSTETTCTKCGRGVEVPIDPNFLYQTG